MKNHYNVCRWSGAAPGGRYGTGGRDRSRGAYCFRNGKSSLTSIVLLLLFVYLGHFSLNWAFENVSKPFEVWTYRATSKLSLLPINWLLFALNLTIYALTIPLAEYRCWRCYRIALSCNTAVVIPTVVRPLQATNGSICLRIAGLRIRIGFGFNRVSGSGSGFGIRIPIPRRAKMTHCNGRFWMPYFIP